MLTPTHIISIFITLLLVTFVGIYSLRRVKSSSDFTTGGQALTTPLIMGTIVGTLVGGSSTIGTAQLAFTFGFSAWWFTLGAGIACLVLGIFLAKPLRQSGATTAPGLLGNIYGEPARVLASVFSSLGIFLNIIAQILAAVAILTSILNVNPIFAAMIAIFFVIVYVIFGGVWGTGLVGTLKMFLLYFSMVIVGVLSYKHGGGMSGYFSKFESFPWFSLFGRGMKTDLAAAFSMLVGVLSTQTYLQAMFSGKDVKASRKGAIFSGLFIPPIGIAGIFVGLYMRAYFPNINPSEALPLFVIQYLPDWIGGIVIATLFISVIGTGAGLVLGVSTIISRDIYKKYIKPDAIDRDVLKFSRLLIVFVTGLTLLFVAGNMNSLILKWSFLSMGLRGATICLPLLTALFMKNSISERSVVLTLFVGPVATILWAIFGDPAIDPLYIGLLISVIILLLGFLIVNGHDKIRINGHEKPAQIASI
jgi:SSS family solute:Na+ symporter